MRDPFLQALGSDIGIPPVDDLHRFEGVLHGRCRIERGKGSVIAGLLKLGGFPPSGEDVPVRLAISRQGQVWTWERRFGDHLTRSELTLDPERHLVRERMRGLSLWLRPVSVEDRLNIELARLSVLGIPVPSVCLPRSETCEFRDGPGRFAFDVGADLPGLGRLIRYRGWLEPVAEPADAL